MSNHTNYGYQDNWPPAHIPDAFYMAGRTQRDKLEDELDRRDRNLLSFTGIPLGLSVALSTAAAAASLVNRHASIALTVAALLTWTAVLMALALRLRIKLALRSDRQKYARDAFKYCMDAAGGPGVLAPLDLLRLAEQGRLETVQWLDENVPEPSERETFKALAQQWTGTSLELAEAARSL